MTWAVLSFLLVSLRMARIGHPTRGLHLCMCPRTDNVEMWVGGRDRGGRAQCGCVVCGVNVGVRS